MAHGLAIRTDVATAGELRRLANKTKGRRTAQRMLATANALEGMSRAEAARASGIEQQSLCDAGKQPAREEALAQAELDPLDGVEFGAVGRQSHESHNGRDGDQGRVVPAGAVELHDGLGAAGTVSVKSRICAYP